MAKPRELDFNLQEMRTALAEELLQAVRGVMTKLTDLEHLERLLGGGHTLQLPAARQNGSRPPRRPREPRTPVPLPPSGNRRSQVRETLIAAIQKAGATGRSTTELVQRLHALSLIPADHPNHLSRQMVRDALETHIQAGEIRAERRGGTEGNRFFAGSATPTAPASSGLAWGDARQVLLDAMAAKPNVTTTELHDVLVAQGFPHKFGKKTTLSHTVHTYLRNFIRAGLVSRKDKAGTAYYKLRRPLVRVTKDEA